MLVVTTNDIPGWEIRSRNAFAQIGAGFKSMFGGELQGMTKNLADSRNKADRQGFVGYPGALCNSTNPSVVFARSADSALVICETGVGRFHYRGVGLQNGGLSVEIEDPVQTGAGFVATNNGVQYSVSPGALLITQGSSVLSNEPMLEYWSG